MIEVIADHKEGWIFNCLGCGNLHYFDLKKHTWNDDKVNPTVNPSILYDIPVFRGNPAVRCHFFIKDAKIKYLDDCTHELAGKTVDMTDINGE